MAQTQSVQGAFGEVANLAVGTSNAASVVLLESAVPQGAFKFGVQVAPTVRAFTAFLIEAKFHRQGAYQTITSAVTATPPAPVTSANATLATLAAASIGWLLMDCKGMSAIRISATGSVDTTGLCDAFGTFS